jgi:hypothetical protein
MENLKKKQFSDDENVREKVANYIEEQMNLIYDLRDLLLVANTVVKAQQREINHLKRTLSGSYESICNTLQRDYHTDFIN